MRKFQKRAYLLAVQVRGDSTGCRSPPCHSQGSSSADSAGCGPPSRLRAAGPWHSDTHHEGSGISPKVSPRTTEIKVSLPSALPHSEPALLHRLGLTGRCECAAGTRTRLSVPAQAQRGVKTEDSEAAEVLWGTAGLWHLWPVAGPSQHIPQLCPSLPSWATAVTPADLQGPSIFSGCCLMG